MKPLAGVSMRERRCQRVHEYYRDSALSRSRIPARGGGRGIVAPKKRGALSEAGAFDNEEVDPLWNEEDDL